MNDNKTILVVEDEIFSSKYLVEILKSLGYQKIFESTNAKDAHSIAKSDIIDICFMDINIKGENDGIQCSDMLNQLYDIPIIYTTAYGDSETIKEASNTNFYGYLVKPFEVHDVESSIQIVLKMLQKENKYKNPTILNTTKINLSFNTVFDIKNKTLLSNNILIKITNKELDLLYFFCTNPNQNISYDTLKEDVWKNGMISHSTIRDTIARLKKKIPDFPLENIINFGYLLKIDNLKQLY